MDNGKKVILCVLDGWGLASEGPGNAISLANPQTYNHLLENCPQTQLIASGAAVGLPEDQYGNSETGHLNIGAGRVVFQDLALINMSIADGSFFTNPALLDTVKHLTSFQSRLHLIGMVSSHGVHSYNEHLFALLLFARKHHLSNVFLHLITDGRDSPPTDAVNQIELVENKIKELQTGRIVSLAGRYYAMDRDQRLDRTSLAFESLVNEKPKPSLLSAKETLLESYRQKITDEFVRPITIGQDASQTRIRAGDAAIFFNFRTDRPRQLTEMFLRSGIPNLRFVTMTKYRSDFQNPTLFSTTTLTNTLGEIISKNNFNQLRSAETEKIAMVTYYFNGQSEKAFPGETHLFVDSQKVATYDLAPRMSTDKLSSDFCAAFQGGQYKLGVINLAAPDMVAHTGIVSKTIEAIKACDEALSKLVNLAKETNSYLVITADHGNAEELINLQTNERDTEHSNNPVPFVIYHPQDQQFQLQPGKLGDIAPTILNLLDLPAPLEMNGKNLILRPAS